MNETFTDKYGRTVECTGTVGGSITYEVTDNQGGHFTMSFATKGPPWSVVKSRIEAMQPSWYVPPEPEPEPEVP